MPINVRRVIAANLRVWRWRPLLLLAAVMLLAPLYALAEQNDTQGLLFEAIVAEENGDLSEAAKLYRAYLAADELMVDRQLLLMRLSIIEEALRHGQEPAVELILQALSDLEYGNYAVSLDKLKVAEAQFGNSVFHDDILYLLGYIQMTRLYQFESAHVWYQRLRLEHPQSTYSDTAQYSEAIILEQLGNTRAARSLLEGLRDRHSRSSAALLGLRWPKDNMTARLWFNRADRRLAIMDERAANAAWVTGQQVVREGEHQLRVKVKAAGKELELLLSPSQVVPDKLTVASSDGESEIRWYAGKVVGEADSWARVSLQGKKIAGVVTIANKRYHLLADSLVGTMDYYLPRRKVQADTDIVLDDYVMQPPVGDETTVTTMDEHGVLRAASKAGALISKVVPINVVVDSQYNAYYGNQGLQNALSAINVADGIFREQHGVGLDVVDTRVLHDSASDPLNLGAVTLEQMLRRFREYRLTERESLSPAALTYLFSGNRNTDAAIGLAWIGALCRSDGYDVGVTTPSNYSDLLLAHEVGHSMGAAHDTDTECREEVDQLMWPRISSKTHQHFTDCSVSAVSRYNDSSCLVDALDIALSAYPGEALAFEIEVENRDSSRTVPDTRLLLDRTAVMFDQLPQGCQESSALEIACASGPLAPGERKRFAFNVPALSADTLTLLAEVEPVALYEAFPGNNRMELLLTSDGGQGGSVSTHVPDNSGGTRFNEDDSSNSQVDSGSSAGGGVGWWLMLTLLAYSGVRIGGRSLRTADQC